MKIRLSASALFLSIGVGTTLSFTVPINREKIAICKSHYHSHATQKADAQLSTGPSSSGPVVASMSSSLSSSEGISKTKDYSVPSSLEEMVRQVSTSVKEASSRGIKNQIVRILVPRDASSGDFGKYVESSATGSDSESSSSFSSSAEVALVPPDESWQGGIMQLYRSVAPTGEQILREVTSSSSGGLPPRVKEDRSVDESGVDGVGLLQTDDGQISCWVQPTQENVDEIVKNSATNRAGEGDDGDVVVLLNPQWRQVDDALDAASKGDGLFSGLASFLGGKGGALRSLKEAGFEPVYTLEGYVCRGANVRMLQVLDSEWSVFCERDSGEGYIAVGKSSDRPTYQEIESMLQNSDIGYKYARDMGFQPKL